MFNFFDEIKKILPESESLESYNIVNIAGKILYVEGHLGLTVIAREQIRFKVRSGVISVQGTNLALAELADTTMKIIGQIDSVVLEKSQKAGQRK